MRAPLTAAAAAAVGLALIVDVVAPDLVSRPASVRVPLGRRMKLTCAADSELTNRQPIIWYKESDDGSRNPRVLSVGNMVYEQDLRLRARMVAGNKAIELSIDSVEEGDAGVYECSLSTQPPKSVDFTVTVGGEGTEQEVVVSGGVAEAESVGDGGGAANGEIGPVDQVGEEAWYSQEGQPWYGEGQQPWYDQEQPWYGQDSFGPMAPPPDYDFSDGQLYQPQEQQSYWAQQPKDQVNGGEWYSPDQNGQMYVPDLNGQSYLPDQNGQPYLPDQNGQGYFPDQNGQPYLPDQSGQPSFLPELNGSPYMPEVSGESQESDGGVLAETMGSYSNGWYTPMASVAPEMTADWNGGVEYPNQWYNMDPYGPVPNYDQNPCDYMYQYYYDDCNSGSHLDNGDNFKPKCEASVCLVSCESHFGYNEGVCFNNECYCRNQGMDWTHQNQKDWPSKYPECAVSDVHQQSPVDIEPKFIKDLSMELFYNQLYGSNMSFIAINTGHGLRHYVQANQLPAVQVMENLHLHQGGGENHQIEMGTYVLAFIDYHWNISEHYILGKHGDLEAQLHHFDLSYGTYEDALEVPGAVLSIALIFKSDPTESSLDDRLFPDSIMKPDKAGEVVQGVSFIDLRGEKASKRYGLYRGTLTYPPCTRNVNWLVSAEMHPIRADQIERLQRMQDPLGRPIVSNSRRLKGQVGA